MATPATHWIVTANFTFDGSVAYRREDGRWTRELAEAGLFADEASATPVAQASAQKEQFEVCDPYPIDVHVGESGIEPTTARERIRAFGPTVPYERPASPAAASSL